MPDGINHQMPPPCVLFGDRGSARLLLTKINPCSFCRLPSGAAGTVSNNPQAWQMNTHIAVAGADSYEAAGHGRQRADLRGRRRVAEHGQQVRQHVLALSSRVCDTQACGGNDNFVTK